jgi:hypothetical protein
VDLASGLASVAAASEARVKHFVYVSVAQPASMMQAYPNLRKLEDHLLAAWRTEPERGANLIGRGWLLEAANAGAQT